MYKVLKHPMIICKANTNKDLSVELVHLSSYRKYGAEYVPKWVPLWGRLSTQRTCLEFSDLYTLSEYLRTLHPDGFLDYLIDDLIKLEL